jgi:hypothetical protein
MKRIIQIVNFVGLQVGLLIASTFLYFVLDDKEA